jgi:hypothetical protein
LALRSEAAAVASVIASRVVPGGGDGVDSLGSGDGAGEDPRDCIGVLYRSAASEVAPTEWPCFLLGRPCAKVCTRCCLRWFNEGQRRQESWVIGVTAGHPELQSERFAREHPARTSPYNASLPDEPKKAPRLLLPRNLRRATFPYLRGHRNAAVRRATSKSGSATASVAAFAFNRNTGTGMDPRRPQLVLMEVPES